MWIVYFVVYGLYSLLAMAGALFQEPIRVIAIETIIHQPLLVLATYCYTFRRRLLPVTVWNVVLVLSLILWILSFLDVLWPSFGLFHFLTGVQRPSIMGNFTLTALSFLFDCPALYAACRLGIGVVRDFRKGDSRHFHRSP